MLDAHFPGVPEHRPAEALAVMPLELPRLTRSEARAFTALAQRAQECRFSWLGREWSLTLRPLPQGPLMHAGGDGWTIQVQWGGAPFLLQVPAAIAEEWIAGQFPGLEVPALTDAFAGAILEAVLGDLVESIEALQRGPATLRSLSREIVEPSGLAHGFMVEARGAERVIRAHLATDSLGLMLAAGLVARQPAAINALDVSTLRLLVRAEIGSTRLDACAVRQLAVGDVVLIDHCHLSESDDLWLGREGWGLRGRVEGSRMTVTAPFSRSGVSMPAHEHTLPGGDSPDPLQSLPLQLTFDVGERTLTLAELQALQVGQVLDLQRPLSSAVSLRVNGHLVGCGELVEVDGRLGVSVSALAQRLPLEVSPDDAGAELVRADADPAGPLLQDASGAMA